MHIKTRIIHSGTDRDPFTGASGVPLYQASTFDQRKVLSGGGYDYTRSANPTRDALEQSMAELEGGAAGFAFASGMAAISSVLLLFSAGDHLLVSSDVYGGSFRVLTRLFSRWGLQCAFVDTTSPKAIRAAIKPESKGIFVETPSNPLLRITDLAEVAAFAQEHKLLSIVDNTFATPYLQKPLALGCDIVVHSATKFLNGHSDLLAGIVVTREQAWAEKLRFIQNAFGAVLGVHDSWLLLRGLKTLAVRMEAAQAGAAEIARRLERLACVRQVYYPDLPDHAGRSAHAAQAAGPGAVVSFELSTMEHTRRLLEKAALPLVSVSLGGVETIISHPATMSHASMSADERAERGISDSLVRLSVGIENPDDIWNDLVQALGQ